MIFNIIILFFTAIVAFWVSAICGGGASLILIPILNLLIPSSVVPFSLTVGTFTSSVTRISAFKKHIKWEIFFWFVPFSIPAVLLGAWFITYINPNYLQLVVALFLIANTPDLLTSKGNKENNQRKYPKYVLIIIGFLAGFISGITGAIGLLFNRFYLRFGLKKEEIIATRAANEVFLHLIKLIIYISIGLYSNMALWLGLAIALATIISSYSVQYILPYLSEFLFKKIGYGAMVLSGIILLMSTSNKIIYEDKMHFSTTSTHHKRESIISWRDTEVILEFTFGDGFEVERSIKPDELPVYLQEKYHELENQYDHIHLEKVFAFRKKTQYEFYCYKNGQLTKYEI
ncbi:sulfite exporter TauE/SafE family protein [Chryseobacterium potabilaquae]|uniref:Probable membrane transporter protein n=1 Tax=Chryseobacterium potabilaquae TaxID=2675057 RepID=A0A6N4XEX5_9FLAO|nr:sulfite exporter TauE/SafE family protein [Chryseobacterium potabilaquae]CAA7197500.1 hypothetical protein CHRY9293_03565 [Chryseobacterium potabilaquae]